MNKRHVLIVAVILLVFLPYFSRAVSTFVVQETEKVKLEPQAIDPDKDNLTIKYEFPLDKNGEWQTTYGDAGLYKTIITVSDGLAATSEGAVIVVKRKEEPPTIVFRYPQGNKAGINEGQSIDFGVVASDLNSDLLTYAWLLNGKKVSDSREFLYSSTYNDAGSYKVIVIVSDGLYRTSAEWDLEVADVDISGILKAIPDIAVDENEIASLKLPDFQKYGLTYTISEPIGNDNQWHTDYDDAGVYISIVSAEGNGFVGSDSVIITVKNVDRLPVFEDIPNQFIRENEQINITLKAADLDNDQITFSAENMPDGATLTGNIFAWNPGFDTVRKEGFVDYLVESFRPLTKSFYLTFKAISSGKEAVKNVIITVENVNRPPVIEEIAPITINEGESFVIEPIVYDPDGDKISLKYSGLTAKPLYKSGYEDAGIHKVTVTASDGMAEVTKDIAVIINNTNRNPIISKIGEIHIDEGDTVSITIDAVDPDGDILSFYVENPPDYFTINGNLFEWTPGYDTASKGEANRFDFIIKAADEESSAVQTATVYVSDKNRKPRIINATQSAVGNVDEPVLMFVKASDDDGDDLTYTWDFGLLDRYKATYSHQRIFTAPGNKVVRVRVSDGTDEVEHLINVHIGDTGGKFPTFNESVLITTRKINITFVEKKSFTRTLVPFEVQQSSGNVLAGRNSPPVITDATTSAVARVNQPILLSVKAYDPDNDPLSYTWNFGIFDSHAGKANNQRTFTSAGLKEIEVTVSDGNYNVKHIIYVNVV